MKKKTVYCNPITERLQLPAENVLNPSTWNPDLGHGDNMSVIEGDPEGDVRKIQHHHGMAGEKARKLAAGRDESAQSRQRFLYTVVMCVPP